MAYTAADLIPHACPFNCGERRPHHHGPVGKPAITEPVMLCARPTDYCPEKYVSPAIPHQPDTV